MNRKFFTTNWCYSLCVLLVAFMPAKADEYETTNFGNKTPSMREVIHGLKPNNTGDLKFRSVLPGGAAAPKKAISMEVNFAYNSYSLSSNAKGSLDTVAKALQDKQLKEYRFLVEGHTDAAGTENYNNHLSERRAQAVKRYLVETSGIEPSRLEIIGRGEQAFLDKNDPYSGVNRRVQLVNLQ